MRSFVQHLKAAWRYGTTYPYLPWYDEADGWELENAAELNQFLDGNTGQRLKARMTNMLSRAALNTVRDPKSTLHDNGKVDGVAAAIAFIEGHRAETLPEEGAEPLSPESLEELEEMLE